MSTIDLQTGFQKDQVVVRVNEKEVFHSTQISTQLLTGLAAQIDLPQVGGPAKIEIDLLSRDASGSFDVKAEGNFFVGISFWEGKIVFINSDRPFGYA